MANLQHKNENNWIYNELFISLRLEWKYKIKPDMEIKKSQSADLNNKKLLFVEIGFVIALLFVYGAFEYKSKEKKEAVLAAETTEIIEEEIIPITQENTPPPPEIAKIPVLSDVIDIVDDDITVEDNVLSLEDDASLGVELMDYVSEVEEEVVEEEAIPYAIVEEKPKFQGGDANTFSAWVNKNLVYPEVARENGVSGRVLLQFTVNATGSVTNVKVVRGVDPALDKEAVRVISSSPKWTPGKQRDRSVPVTYNFPVVFQLR